MQILLNRLDIFGQCSELRLNKKQDRNNCLCGQGKLGQSYQIKLRRVHLKILGFDSLVIIIV